MSKTLKEALLERLGTPEAVSAAMTNDRRTQRKRMAAGYVTPKYDFVCHDGPWAGQTLALTGGGTAMLNIGGVLGAYKAYKPGQEAPRLMDKGGIIFWHPLIPKTLRSKKNGRSNRINP